MIYDFCFMLRNVYHTYTFTIFLLVPVSIFYTEVQRFIHFEIYPFDLETKLGNSTIFFFQIAN